MMPKGPRRLVLGYGLFLAWLKDEHDDDGEASGAGPAIEEDTVEN